MSVEQKITRESKFDVTVKKSLTLFTVIVTLKDEITNLNGISGPVIEIPHPSHQEPEFFIPDNSNTNEFFVPSPERPLLPNGEVSKITCFFINISLRRNVNAGDQE